MESFHERVVSCTDLTLPIGNDKYFFCSLTTKPQQNMESVGGKSMNTLRTESLTALSNMLDDCTRKRDDFRPASENIRMSKLRMCLSRFENPLKKQITKKAKLNCSITLKYYSIGWKMDNVKGVYRVVYSGFNGH